MEKFTEEFSNKFIELAEIIIELKGILVFLEFSEMFELLELKKLESTKKAIPKDLITRLNELENKKNITDLLEEFQNPPTKNRKYVCNKILIQFECFLRLEVFPRTFEETIQKYLQKNEELRKHKDAPSKLSRDFKLKPEAIATLENLAKDIANTIKEIKRIKKIFNQ